MSKPEEDHKISPEDHVLYTMHNLCATKPETSKTLDDIASILKMEIKNLKTILKQLTSEGYIKTIIEKDVELKYHLSGRGIIRVCSTFT